MKNPPFDSLVWGLLTLAPIILRFFFFGKALLMYLLFSTSSTGKDTTYGQ